MQSIPDAIALMLPCFSPRSAERVVLHDALGRHLSQSLDARACLPAFSNSAMDGYAVRNADLRGASESAPVRLPRRGESRAGGGLPEALEEGAVMRIFTGAPMPEGADAVVAQEDTTEADGVVELRVSPSPGRHVRARASDLALGASLLPAGARIGSGEIALLASQGMVELSVHRRPVVAILSTGDELRDPGEEDAPGTLVNSNAPMLAAAVREAGGVPRVLPRCADDPDVIEATLRQALKADVVLTTGGVSVGAYDFLHEVFDRVGVETHFWKIAVKPGKPVRFGMAGDVPVVGLPGNPVSAWVTFQVFVAPGLARMAGSLAPHPGPLPVRLAHAFERHPGRTELARAHLVLGEAGYEATLLSLQGSGSLPSLVNVDALVVLPAEVGSFAQGERLWALPVGNLPGRTVSHFTIG